MTDFEECCEDLTRWCLGFETGEFYDDGGEPEMKYIRVGWDYIKFDMNGNFIDTE